MKRTRSKKIVLVNNSEEKARELETSIDELRKLRKECCQKAISLLEKEAELVSKVTTINKETPQNDNQGEQRQSATVLAKLRKELLRRLSDDAYRVISINTSIQNKNAHVNKKSKLDEEDTIVEKDDETTIDNREIDQNKYTITIRDLCNRKYELLVLPSYTIDRVKSMIAKQKDAPPAEQQRLIFCGRQVDGCSTLGACGIKQGSWLHLVLKLRGGMYHITSGRSDFSPLYPLKIKWNKDYGISIEATCDTTLDEVRKLIVGALEKSKISLDRTYMLGVEELPIVSIDSTKETLLQLGIPMNAEFCFL